MRTSPLRCSGVDHAVLPTNTPHLPLPRSSPEGATTECTCTVNLRGFFTPIPTIATQSQLWSARRHLVVVPHYYSLYVAAIPSLLLA